MPPHSSAPCCACFCRSAEAWRCTLHDGLRRPAEDARSRPPRASSTVCSLTLGSAGVTQRRSSRVHERWARFRFSVVGQLLAAPPPKGTLRPELDKLAAREWHHPITGEPIRFGVSTLELAPLPSYSTLRRFLKAHGLDKRQRATSRRTAGAERAEARLFDREVRSYEAEYVNGLWHWDCHHGSKKVLTARGEWHTPILFGVLDDRSRLACHLQWYLAETAEIIAHGLDRKSTRL